MRGHRLAVLVAALLRAVALSESALAQTMEVRPEQSKATVGDRITLDVTVKLLPGMELLDATPHLLVPPPRGIRFLSADTLRPSGRGEFTGTARVALFRIGQQPVPTLALLYRRTPGGPLDTLLHLPVSVEITPILEPGNPRLKDIKPLIPLGGPAWGPLAILLITVSGGFWWLWRRGRARRPGPGPAALKEPGVLGPFDMALARLAEMEEAALHSGNGVMPIYTGVAAVIRECLREIGAVPHQGFTTGEVSTALPETLAAGELRRRVEAILGDADLVKFARVKPDFAAAREQLARGRSLLEAWQHQADGGPS